MHTNGSKPLTPTGFSHINQALSTYGDDSSRGGVGFGKTQLDMIEGNVGNNILDGKEGVDMLTGHEGADTFVSNFEEQLSDLPGR